jgi:hypothetical protein
MKKVTYQCPICQEEKETTEWRFKRKKTLFCKNCVTIGTQKGLKKPQFSRENSARWGGGEYISSDGYKMVKAEGEYHDSGRQKYKKEHILIYEKELGRELKTQKGNMGEQVHHIDGDKLNNNFSNLLLCSDTQEHRYVHCQLEEVSFELVRKGIIIFDKETNKYKINESRIT